MKTWPVISRGMPDPENGIRTELSLAGLAQAVAARIADAADADHWAISILGLAEPVTAPTGAQMPHPWLVALNGGRAGLYDVTLVLQPGVQPVGRVRLTTIRPGGFGLEDLLRAQAVARRAAAVLSQAIRLLGVRPAPVRDQSGEGAAR